MPRNTEASVTNDRGDEVHPAFGMIGAHRTQTGPKGAVLFDSDVRHQNTIVVRVHTASRKRDLNHDWVHAERQLIEVEMSEAQWASFVSSMNVGDGVPCTIRGRQGADGYRHDVPGVQYEPRLQVSMQETRAAADKAVEEIREAFEAYKEHKTVSNLRTLQARIDNLPSNVSYAAQTLSAHAENVVQKARADIEAMVVAKATQLGIEPGDVLDGAPQLTEGEST